MKACFGKTLSHAGAREISLSEEWNETAPDIRNCVRVDCDLGLALAWRVYFLFGQVRARDRVIRSLGLRLQVTAKGLQPIREELSGKDGTLIRLRSKLRRKGRQMESVSVQSLQREDEIIALRDNLRSKKIELRRLGHRLEEKLQELAAFRSGKAEMEKRLADLAPFRERMASKEEEIASLKDRLKDQATHRRT